MRYQEGITVLDEYDCMVAEQAMKHFIWWLDSVRSTTTKLTEVYGVPIEELIAKSRNLRRSFHARTAAGKKEEKGEKPDEPGRSDPGRAEAG